MVWSFSRLNSYYNCKHEWLNNYINCMEGKNSCFAEFGSLCHEVLEKYCKGELSLFAVSEYYNNHFDDIVVDEFPPNNYKDLRESYYESGLDYFDNIDLDLDNYEILGVEKEISFTVGDYQMMGYIDLLLRSKDTGNIIIVDHKSSNIKFTKGGKPYKKDTEHWQSFKRQLYLYAIPVIEEYGKVDFLEWNMFRSKEIKRIPFSQEEFKEAQDWVIKTIDLIKQETEWSRKDDYDFYCNYLCGQRDNCVNLK